MHHCMQSMPVYLFPELVVVMRRQKARVAEARLRSAHCEDHDLAFPTSIGTPCDPHNVRRVLKPLALSAGFPGAFKGLRHWFASIATTMYPLATVAKVLGHARVSTTTDVYSHLRRSDAERIGVAVSVAVNRKIASENLLQRNDSVRPEGLEPPTDRVETGCSIH